ncbi:MAG: hypothetical protein QM742_07470 [Aquabacterium sp.]
MRVLSPQEISHVSGGATSVAAALKSITGLLQGFFALITGGNFLKYWY